MLENQNCVDLADFSPFRVVPGGRESGILIIVDHARASLPEAYGALGLGRHELARHIAYDIGIEGLALRLHEALGLPVVHSCFSRLLIDPNRGEDDPTLIMKLSDGAVVPGNAEISTAEADHRIRAFYRPYHEAIAEEIDAFLAAGITPILLSLHSFTPVWRGRKRPLHAGILWDRDDRFVLPLLNALREDETLNIGDNQPYTGRLRGDCMYRHGTCRGLAHALLEVRQDLIETSQGQDDFAARMAGILTGLLDDDKILAPCREIRHFGSLTD